MGSRAARDLRSSRLRADEALQVIGVVQAGGVVQAVDHDDPSDVGRLAEVYLPPRIRLLVGMERVLAVLDAVHRSGGIGAGRDGARRGVASRRTGRPGIGLLQPVGLD